MPTAAASAGFPSRPQIQLRLIPPRRYIRRELLTFSKTATDIGLCRTAKLDQLSRCLCHGRKLSVSGTGQVDDGPSLLSKKGPPRGMPIDDWRPPNVGQLREFVRAGRDGWLVRFVRWLGFLAGSRGEPERVKLPVVWWMMSHETACLVPPDLFSIPSGRNCRQRHRQGSPWTKLSLVRADLKNTAGQHQPTGKLKKRAADIVCGCKMRPVAPLTRIQGDVSPKSQLHQAANAHTSLVRNLLKRLHLPASLLYLKRQTRLPPIQLSAPMKLCTRKATEQPCAVLFYVLKRKASAFVNIYRGGQDGKVGNQLWPGETSSSSS